MTEQHAQRIANWQLHPSQRGQFSLEIYRAMTQNERVWCLTADLGYKVLDSVKEDFPDRFVNCGAAESCMIGAAAGIALSGGIPICYSITTFLLMRPFEWHRNFLQHEGIPVRLVGSGLDDDYAHDGISHHAFDAKAIMSLFPRIKTYYPDDKSEIPGIVKAMIDTDEPSFLCLRR